MTAARRPKKNVRPRRGTEGPGLLARGFRRTLSALRVALVVGVLLGLVTGVYAALPYFNPPISQVLVEGDLLRLDRGKLRAAIFEHLDTGIIGLDIGRLNSEIERVPWVESVEVVKEFPSTLRVRVTEARAIAVWNGSGYFSDRGRFIETEPFADLAHLPMLSSPKSEPGSESGARQALEMFHLLNSVVLASDQRILALDQDASGGWIMTWGNGLTINMGRADHLDRIRHVMAAWKRLPDQQRVALRHIDARYDNGIAVRTHSPWPAAASAADQRATPPKDVQPKPLG